MRIGFLAGTRIKLVGIMAAVAVGAALPAASHGQSPYGAYGPGAAGSRPTQALYVEPGESSGGRRPTSVDAYGNPMIVPAGFCQPCNGYGESGGNCGCYDDCNGYGGCNGGCYGPAPCSGGGFNSSMPMGAGGTDPPIGYDLMNDTGVEGDLADQRGPHYFDVRAEAVFLRRDKTFEQNIDFTSLNVGNTIVLSSRELDFDPGVGFRLLGRYDICPLSVVEFGYMGIFDYQSSATANDPAGNLYSLFSRPAPGTGLFGTNPVGVTNPGGPLPFTERAIKHSISFESDLQTAEISYRRYWLGWSPRISGTLLAGFRYTRVGEEFEFNTLGTPNVDPVFTNPAFRNSLDAENNLSGFQAGGDIWVSLMQGFRVGTEGKAGIYDNHYKFTNQTAQGNAGAFVPATFEQFRDDKVAFIGEASVDLVADILPSVSLRAGYEVLFLNSLVLAGENFNQTSPFGNQGTRVPFVNDDGQLFYYGAHAGIEYIW